MDEVMTSSTRSAVNRVPGEWEKRKMIANTEIIICTICGAMSTTDHQAEVHFAKHHLLKDWEEDPFWLRFASAWFNSERKKYATGKAAGKGISGGRD